AAAAECTAPESRFDPSFADGAQPGGAAPRIRGDFGPRRPQRLARQQFIEPLAGAVAEGVLHAPVLEGVVTDDRAAPARLQQARKRREELFELLHLLVDEDAHRLEAAARRMEP